MRPISGHLTRRPAPTAAEGDAPASLVALVVDPEPSVRGLLREWLMGQGWHVIDASEPVESAVGPERHRCGLRVIGPAPRERSEADLIAGIRSRDLHSSIVVLSDDPRAEGVARELGAPFTPKRFAIRDFAMFVGSPSGLAPAPAHFVCPTERRVPDSTPGERQIPQTTGEALDAWRTAERELEGAGRDSPQRTQLEADVRECQRAYVERVDTKTRLAEARPVDDATRTAPGTRRRPRAPGHDPRAARHPRSPSVLPVVVRIVEPR